MKCRFWEEEEIHLEVESSEVATILEEAKFMLGLAYQLYLLWKRGYVARELVEEKLCN